MFKRDDTVYIDRHRHYANALLAYIVSFATLGIFILAVVGAITLNAYRNISIYCFVGVVLLIAFYIFCNNFFVWVKNGRFKEHRGYLVYEYEGVIDVFGNSTTETTIKSVERIKRKRRNLIVYGDITIKEPLRSKKKIKKCVIYNIDEDSYKYFIDFYK